MRTKIIQLLALVGCIGGTALAEPGQRQQRPTQAFTIVYSAGPQWKPNLPPQKQDLGAHFTYVQKLFDEKKLLANGILEDGRGFYVVVAKDDDLARAIVAADPGVDAGVLKQDALEPWLLVIDQFSAPSKSGGLFVLDYRPGPRWKPGRPLASQDLANHLAHVGKAATSGSIVAGGPVDAHHGRYVVALPDAAAASRWVDSDPAVVAGTLRATVTPWQPLHRQSASR